MDVPDPGSKLVILLGGGIDSAALIPFYQARGVPIRGMHFDYGQPSLPGERRAVVRLGQHYSLPVEMIKFGFSLASNNGEYAGRNALLLLGAASLTIPPRSVAIGVHAGVPYYDSTARFIEELRRLFDGYFDGCSTVEAPFAEFTKREVYAFAIDSNVPLGMTFSCERGPDEPCGECPSCRDREVLFGRE